MIGRQNSPSLSEFIRFGIVGTVQNGLNLCVFAIAVASGMPYLLASVVAAIVALSVSFALNRRWTFRGRTDQTAGRAIRFVTIWIIVVLLALPALAFLVDVVHLPQILAQAIVILIGAPASYAAQRRWTFSDGSNIQVQRGHSREPRL